MMDRDMRTRTGVRAPGVERCDRSHGGVPARSALRHRTEAHGLQAGDTKGGSKPGRGCPSPGQAPPDRPALKPYWGKPAVRHLRGDDGNVGIMRSPVRAIVLPGKRPVLSSLGLHHMMRWNVYFSSQLGLCAVLRTILPLVTRWYRSLRHTISLPVKLAHHTKKPRRSRAG